ncbi:CinA family protein [bacterium]|nr:MAG: CinA family protein [bacterium]
MPLSPEERIKRALTGAGETLALAESCTGGLIASRITGVAGSSEYFDRGLVTYSQRAKAELLGVSGEIFRLYGEVSEECALAMARGLLERHGATVAASVTGIAGPGGGTPEKPVGTVWIAWGGPEGLTSELLSLSGDRAAVQARAAGEVLLRLAVFAEKRRRKG